MMTWFRSYRLSAIAGMGWLAAALLILSLRPPTADAVASFYSGKTIQVLIGYSAGGGYDTYARILARHMGRHIPGKPALVPQNMPGAGSLRALNYLYNVAPKDGTVIATFARGLAMEPLFGRTQGIQFDATKLTWIGSITNEVSVCAFWHTTDIHTWQDVLAKKFTVGGTGSGSDTDDFANVVRNMFHAKLKLITGFPGGSDVVLALERHEIDGRCGWSWSSLISRNKALYDEKKIYVPVQLALQKHEDISDVPLILDLTKDPKEKAALKLIFSRQTMARPFAAPPGIPAERAQALRAAFEATMKDPEFLAEAQRLRLEVQPVSGSEIEALIKEIYASPPEVVKLAGAAIKDAQ